MQISTFLLLNGRQFVKCFLFMVQTEIFELVKKVILLQTITKKICSLAKRTLMFASATHISYIYLYPGV